MIDVEKLGYGYYKTEIRLSDYTNIKEILQFCHENKNISQVDKTIGGETLEIEFHVQTIKEMINTIKELEKKFPKTIEKYTYLTIIGEQKITFMPGGNYEEL